MDEVLDGTRRMLTPRQVAERMGLRTRTVLRGRLRALLPWKALSKRTLRLDARALERFIAGDDL